MGGYFRVNTEPLKRAQALPELVKYILAGGLAAAVNWLVRFPLSTVMQFLPAVILAFAIGMFVGFAMYRTFVFPGSARPTHLQIRDFIAVNLVTLAIVASAAMELRNLLEPYMTAFSAEAVAHASAIAIGAALNYLGHSVFTFGARQVPP